MKKIIKASLLIVFCIVFMLSSLSAVWAAGSEFTLSHAHAKKGRLFTVTLDCKGDRKIGSFIAEIEYNAVALEYRTAKVMDKSAEFSVNSTQEGMVRLVYLCEEGAECKSKTPLVELTFKALQTGDHGISLGVRQVIDSSGADVVVSGGTSAIVRVEASANSPNAQSSGSDKSEEADPKNSVRAEDSTKIDDNEVGSQYATVIDGRDHDVLLIIVSVLTVLTLLCLVGFCAYKYGIKAASKEKGQTPDGSCSAEISETPRSRE